ncbi:putative ethylene-responsive transcription factor 3-like [Capsicum annuum]|nr:putative ethylene-responsive transcription factor 3-like [Capsicum annuum]
MQMSVAETLETRVNLNGDKNIRYKEKRWDSKRMLSSGGMPSSHSATVTALVMAIYLQEGAGGSTFAIAVVLACVCYPTNGVWGGGVYAALSYLEKGREAVLVDPRASAQVKHIKNQVMYDATGVRLHAGRQAELLNQIVCELPPEHPVANVRPLRDSLGHTPLQVFAGAVLGCLVPFLLKPSI